jgi:3-carboxy-cis,cis-muconate cycloisomerase
MFERLVVPAELVDATSDAAWLASMLEAERALASASARAGLIPDDAAEAIAAACRADRFDVERLAVDGRSSGNPAEPLVRALADAVGGDAAAYVHRGATSQDIVDTAAMLVTRRALDLLVGLLDGVESECARLAEAHRSTPIVARTLLQQAVPTTFGLKAATWLVGLLHARRTLLSVKLHAQLGGAGGTLALLGDRALDVLSAYARELDLVEPIVPWHATRGPVRELANALGVAAGAAAKIALDVALLAQDEVGEVRVPAGGVSSTMPHKRNPVAAVRARACARRADALVATFTGEHEHERAAGAWHAEWESLTDLLGATGGALAGVRELLEGLEVDADRMRRNVRPETTSESGREIEPEDYVGVAAEFVDRAIDAFREDLS